MRRRSWNVDASARSRASVDTVWSLVGEAARWKEWSWMSRTFLVRDGDPPPDGVGAIRRFAWGPGGSREEVVAWEPPYHLGYVTLSGLPVRDYRADVRLARDGSGTVVTWRSTFETLVPGTGRIMHLIVSRLVRGFAASVCRYADRLETAAGHPDGV